MGQPPASVWASSRERLAASPLPGSLLSLSLQCPPRCPWCLSSSVASAAGHGTLAHLGPPGTPDVCSQVYAAHVETQHQHWVRDSWSDLAWTAAHDGMVGFSGQAQGPLSGA